MLCINDVSIKLEEKISTRGGKKTLKVSERQTITERNLELVCSRSSTPLPGRGQGGVSQEVTAAKGWDHRATAGCPAKALYDGFFRTLALQTFTDARGKEHPTVQ